MYLAESLKITCLYKNGMDSNGFEKNITGTGVSVVEKKNIYDGVFSYISPMVQQPEMPVRVGSTKNVLKKLNVDEINFNKGLDENQRIQLAGRMRECIESDILHLEVYYMNDAKECAQEIISELQTVIKEQVELKEIEIPGTITFQVMSVDGGNVSVGAGEVLLLRYSATHLEYSHELEDENQKFHMAVHIIYCKEQKGLFGKVKYKTIKHRKEIITEADWKNGKKVSLYED